MLMQHKLVKRRIWEIIEVAYTEDQISRAFDTFILGLILVNVVAVIMGTVGEVQQRYGVYLFWLEIISVIIFTAEYLARLWSCTADPRFASAVRGRLRFATTPMAVIDLLAIAPFFLPILGLDFRFIRLVRLFRVFRLAKLGRYVESFQLLGRVVRSRKEELVSTLSVLLLLLVLTASMMYYAESPVQPEAFPHIPAAMWWAVATLTTVGYGDIYPISTMGRLLGAAVAILGIGLFALPTAVLGAGFLEEIQKRKEKSVCPHCGETID